MHRLLMTSPTGTMVDHINGNGLDNRKENLRVVTNSQNLMNRGKNKNNTSGYKGVLWDKVRNKWIALIGFNNKNIYLGRFFTKNEAAFAYNAKAEELFGEFAQINIIE